MSEIKNKILSFLPEEYLGEIKLYNPSEFITEMEEKSLFFQKKENEISHLAWWKSKAPYKTVMEKNLDVESLDKSIKNSLMELFDGTMIIHFNCYSNGELRWVALEISSELFFSMDIIYCTEFSSLFNYDFIFISKKDYKNWMIPSKYSFDRIMTNIPIDHSSVKETIKPWQSFFTDMDIEGAKPDLNLFSWGADNNYHDDLSFIFSKLEDILNGYYRGNKEEHTPDFIFSSLSEIANNKDYNFVFRDYWGEDHTLQWIIRKEIENWHYNKYDVLDGPCDPDRKFYNDVDTCLSGIREIEW